MRMRFGGEHTGAQGGWHSRAVSARWLVVGRPGPGYTASRMPIYEYLCENGHRFEVLQRMSDDALTTCEVCGAPVQRVLHPVAVHFKGSGFYTTDYGTKRRARELERSAKDGADKSGSGSSEKSSSSSSDGAGTGSSEPKKPSRGGGRPAKPAA